MPKRFMMRQKLLALGDDFMIKDAGGSDVYFVDGRAFSIGNQLSFQDLQKNELCFIKQRLLAWGPTYEIYRNGGIVARVKKELFTLYCRFDVDLPGENLIAEGDLVDHEYVFKRGDEVVATVSKQWFTLTDTYGVEIDDKEDAVLLLASTVVVDMACHPDARH